MKKTFALTFEFLARLTDDERQHLEDAVADVRAWQATRSQSKARQPKATSKSEAQYSRQPQTAR